MEAGQAGFVKDRDLELLLGEHPSKSWQIGELLVSEEALPLLARENVPFVFEGLEALNDRINF